MVSEVVWAVCHLIRTGPEWPFITFRHVPSGILLQLPRSDGRTVYQSCHSLPSAARFNDDQQDW